MTGEASDSVAVLLCVEDLDDEDPELLEDAAPAVWEAVEPAELEVTFFPVGEAAVAEEDAEGDPLAAALRL